MEDLEEGELADVEDTTEKVTKDDDDISVEIVAEYTAYSRKRIVENNAASPEVENGYVDPVEEDEQTLFVRGGSPVSFWPAVDERGISLDLRNESSENRSKTLSRSRKAKPRGNRGSRRHKFDIPCSYYLEGSCKRGRHCPYTHNRLRKLEFLQPELCKFYTTDECVKGHSCPYLHQEFPCRHYHSRCKCPFLPNCKFNHGKLTNQLKIILNKHLKTAPKSLLGDFHTWRSSAIPSLLDMKIPTPPVLLQDKGTSTSDEGIAETDFVSASQSTEHEEENSSPRSWKTDLGFVGQSTDKQIGDYPPRNRKTALMSASQNTNQQAGDCSPWLRKKDIMSTSQNTEQENIDYPLWSWNTDLMSTGQSEKQGIEDYSSWVRKTDLMSTGQSTMQGIEDYSSWVRKTDLMFINQSTEQNRDCPPGSRKTDLTSTSQSKGNEEEVSSPRSKKMCLPTKKPDPRRCLNIYQLRCQQPHKRNGSSEVQITSQSDSQPMSWEDTELNMNTAVDQLQVHVADGSMDISHDSETENGYSSEDDDYLLCRVLQKIEPKNVGIVDKFKDLGEKQLQEMQPQPQPCAGGLPVKYCLTPLTGIRPLYWNVDRTTVHPADPRLKIRICLSKRDPRSYNMGPLL